MTGQLLRTLTTGLVDEDWGKDAIDEIENVASKGHEGDTPAQPPFAKNKLFWMLAVNGVLMGVVIGLASLVFINIIDEVPKVWSDVDTHGGYDFEEEENVGFNDGKVCNCGPSLLPACCVVLSHCIVLHCLVMHSFISC